MKEEIIKFNKHTLYKGRNGYGRCFGITLTDWDTITKKSQFTNNITLNIMNSQGNSSAIQINIPREHIQEFIKKLQTFL